MSTSLISYTLRSRHIHSLPPEMIADSFWYLSFTEVRYAAQVCQRWRDLGIDHPIFWRYIEATSITPGALKLLRARIGQSDGRPFTFKVDVKGNSRIVERDLIDIIGAALHNVRDLTVFLDALVMMDLFAMLKHKAPKLKRLHLRLYSQDRCVPRIPLWVNVFGNIPGGLEFVHLDDILLDQGAEVIPSFANVTYLEHCLPPSIEANFPAFVFRLCPSLKGFTFRCGRVTYGDPLTKADLEAISRLEHFCIDIADDVSRTQFISLIPLGRVRNVTMARVLDPDSVYDFLAPLRSPFLFGFSESQIALSDAKHTFDVDVEDHRSGYRRTFAQFRSDYERKPRSGEESCINALLENEDFHTQLLTLSCAASLWTLLVPHLDCYQHVEKLILTLDDMLCLDPVTPYTLPRAPFRFTGLRLLGLRTRNEFVYVDAQDLVNFINRVAPTCTVLELRRVVLAGSFRLDQFVYTRHYTYTVLTGTSRLVTERYDLV